MSVQTWILSGTFATKRAFEALIAGKIRHEMVEDRGSDYSFSGGHLCPPGSGSYADQRGSRALRFLPGKLRVRFSG